MTRYVLAPCRVNSTTRSSSGKVAIGISLKPWAWEIYRDGKPLPIRLRRDGFKSEHTAKLAGTVALREFLSALAREEANPD